MRTKQNIKNKKERYLGIVIPQLPGKDVKGWCISWIEGKVIPGYLSSLIHLQAGTQQEPHCVINAKPT